MDTRAILNKVEELAAPVIANLGYELIERELVMDAGRWTLRLYIDKEGGVTVDDCARVSRGVGDVIEVEGIVPMKYDLEVSSPGIDRPLRRRGDFEKFKGRQIRLKTLKQINGRGNYKGTLEGMDGDDIVIAVDGAAFKVPYSELAKAKIVG